MNQPDEMNLAPKEAVDAEEPCIGNNKMEEKMLLKKLSDMSRQKKILVMLLADIFILPVCLWAAVGLRTDHWSVTSQYPLGMYFVTSLVAVPIFIRLGLYRSVVRYMEDRAILAIVAAVTVSIGIFGSLIFFLNLSNVPRGALAIYWLLAIVYIVCSRFFARAAFRLLPLTHRAEKVLIYGAGEAGRQLTAALSMGSQYEPVAFVDDDESKRGLRIAGLKVYSARDLPNVTARLGIRQILLAIPSISRSRRIEIVNAIEPLALEVRVVPGVEELVSGEAKLDDVREVGIDELLGREVVAPNMRLLRENLAEKVVMVTGAGGSIGSELCRQIVRHGPRRLVLYEISEFALYSLEYELQRTIDEEDLAVELVPVLGSVRNVERLYGIMSRYGVQTIYHAAAYKHVPIVEFNMTEGILNNAVGTRMTAEAAIRANVESFVLISTDKAVRPTNVMGASKRMAELCLQAFAQDPSVRTRFSIVRFGNVLGSSGSVVPLFRKQIATGGPVTVTHPDIIRYFMTIPEAAQLVIQAGAMGGRGEVFVLDMGQPVRILDLARRMIHLSGFQVRDESNPDGDIEIRFSGLRPGEKLYEELLIGDAVSGTSHPRIMMADESCLTRQQLEETMQQLLQACETNDCEAIRDILLECVSGFRPDATIKDHLHQNVPPRMRLLR